MHIEININNGFSDSALLEHIKLCQQSQKHIPGFISSTQFDSIEKEIQSELKNIWTFCGPKTPKLRFYQYNEISQLYPVKIKETGYYYSPMVVKVHQIFLIQEHDGLESIASLNTIAKLFKKHKGKKSIPPINAKTDIFNKEEYTHDDYLSLFAKNQQMLKPKKTNNLNVWQLASEICPKEDKKKLSSFIGKQVKDYNENDVYEALVLFEKNRLPHESIYRAFTYYIQKIARENQSQQKARENRSTLVL